MGKDAGEDKGAETTAAQRFSFKTPFRESFIRWGVRMREKVE